MMRVLIVDSNEARRVALATKLTQQALSISSIPMINMDNYSQSDLQVELMVLLDQDPVLVNTLINHSSAHTIKAIFTNTSSELLNQNARVLNLENEELEENLVNKINYMLESDDDEHCLPIAVDPHSKATLEMARKAAKTNATVLIHGETGVGKEILAHYIHHHSTFKNGPFISVNCAALPDNMIEAILFGYEKGAFTSAINSYMGKFEQAQNGTLLLDEISEISIGLQAKLLRVLQEREVERLGGRKLIKINTRIIAATNRDLKQQVANGLFRKDLYYRLNVIPIHCISLRERVLDILPLVEFFISKHAKNLNLKDVELSQSAKEKLINYNWPGNIREMDNVIQRALIMAENNFIDENDIQLNEITNELAQPNVVDMNLFSSKLEEHEAKIIIDALKETDGCRNDAAKKLNISPRTLRHKIAKLKSIGIDVP